MADSEEVALHSELEGLRALIDAVPATISWVSSDLRYIGINQRLSDILGVSKSDFVGREVGYLGDQSPYTRFVQSIFKDPADKISTEVTFNLAGKTAHILFVSQKYDGGKKAVVIGMDVTPLKEALQVIEDQKLRIASSSKLAALGEVAAQIAHEINNPLAVIKGRAQNLVPMQEQGLLTSETCARVATTIDTTVDRITKIIRGIRTFARNAESDPLAETPLRLVVEDTLVLCQDSLKAHGIRLTVAPIQEDLRIWCRATEISQVLVNLFNNARDAIENREDKWIRLEAARSGDSVEIRVTDCGDGIPESVRAKLFQPFFTTKESGKGTGIGLPLSRRIIDAHGGVLSIDSGSPNTCFVISLPSRAPG